MLKPVAYVEELASSGIEVQTLSMNRGRPDPRAVLRLARWVRTFRPDVVHSHMVHANLLTRVTRWFAPMPRLICTAHNIDEGGRFRELLYRFTDRFCDLTTNVSQRAVERYVDIKAVPATKILRVPNGIDLTRYYRNELERVRLREQMGARNGFVWLAVGRFVPEKDYGNMLHSFAALQAGENCQLWIAGDGEEREAAEQLCLELQLEDRVHFLGIRSDISSLMSAADAYVMSSKWEGLPMVLLEASACELPIVATDVGGNGEIVRAGGGGFVVEPCNPPALAKKMQELMAASTPERQEMGRRAREHVLRHYELGQTLTQWERIYGPNTLKGTVVEPSFE